MWWLVGLLLIIIGGLAFIMYVMHGVVRGLTLETSLLLSEVSNLKKENKALKAHVKRLEGKGTQKKKRAQGPDFSKFGL